MSSYSDLLDELVSFQSPVANDHVDQCVNEGTGWSLLQEDDAPGLKMWLRGDTVNRVNARHPSTGRSLLHQACAEGQKEVVKVLLQDTDANLTLRTMLGGSTALHLAVTNNHRSVAFQLLSYGADALTRDKFGCTPMHYVKSISVAKLLVQYGGRVLDYNSKRKSVLESVAAEDAVDDEDSSHTTKDQDAQARKELHKYLKQIAEGEYKTKLAKLRELKQQAKTQQEELNGKKRTKKTLKDFH